MDDHLRLNHPSSVPSLPHRSEEVSMSAGGDISGESEHSSSESYCEVNKVV